MLGHEAAEPGEVLVVVVRDRGERADLGIEPPARSSPTARSRWRVVQGAPDRPVERMPRHRAASVATCGTGRGRGRALGVGRPPVERHPIEPRLQFGDLREQGTLEPVARLDHRGLDGRPHVGPRPRHDGLTRRREPDRPPTAIARPVRHRDEPLVDEPADAARDARLAHAHGLGELADGETVRMIERGQQRELTRGHRQAARVEVARGLGLHPLPEPLEPGAQREVPQLLHDVVDHRSSSCCRGVTRRAVASTIIHITGYICRYGNARGAE